MGYWNIGILLFDFILFNFNGTFKSINCSNKFLKTAGCSGGKLIHLQTCCRLSSLDYKLNKYSFYNFSYNFIYLKNCNETLNEMWVNTIAKHSRLGTIYTISFVLVQICIVNMRQHLKRCCLNNKKILIIMNILWSAKLFSNVAKQK